MSDDAPEGSPGEKPSAARLRTLGITHLLLAVFCAVVAGVPWPGKQGWDTLLWLGMAAVLLLVGGWYIALSRPSSPPPCP